VNEDVKGERLARLQTLLTRHQTEFQDSMIGKTLPILVEKAGRETGQVIGKSPYLHATHFMADMSNIGKVVDVKIVATERNSLSGEKV